MNIQYELKSVDTFYLTKDEQEGILKFCKNVSNSFESCLEISNNFLQDCDILFDEYVLQIVELNSVENTFTKKDYSNISVVLTLQEIYQTIRGLKSCEKSIENHLNDFRISSIKNSYKLSIELLKLQFIDLLNRLKEN